jgi:uncharacterized secreted repeat protein (TIGR03808 family)
MALNRRRLFAFSAAGAAVAAAQFAAAHTRAAPRNSADAGQLGLRAGSPDDQSRTLQAAIDKAAATRAPLALGPGVYRAGDLNLPAGAQIMGVRGATRLILSRGPSLISANDADTLTLSGLTLDGGGVTLAEGRGLLHLTRARGVRITDCEVVGSGGNGITLEACEGEVTGSTVTGPAAAGIFSLDAQGLKLAGNTVRGAGNNGILVWR